MESFKLFILVTIFYFGSLLSILLFFFKEKKKSQYELENRYRSLVSFHHIYQLILENLDYEIMIQKIADIIPNELKFATGVLAILDENTNTLKRVAASQTKPAQKAIDFINTGNIPFEKIEISITEQSNIMSRALSERKSFVTEDIYDVLGPALSKTETKRVQEILGTKTTFVYPIFIKDKPIGVFLASTKKRQNELSTYEIEVMNSLVNLIGLALQNSKLYTSLKEASNGLNDANKKLQQLDHLKDEFVSVASHEIRTPMTVIKSYLWMTLAGKGGEISEKQKYYINRAYLSADRLIKLVNDLLNISRIESGRLTLEMKKVDLYSLVVEIIEEIMPRANELNIKILIQKPKSPLSNVMIDPDKIKEVLYNLIGNSLKFTLSDGQIIISMVQDGDFVTTTITDNGRGIDVADLGKLFHKFALLDGSFTPNQPVQGTGLGLYICRSIIQLHGGNISVTSQGLGKGSSFIFSLKVFQEEEMAKIQKEQEVRTPTGIVHTLL